MIRPKSTAAYRTQKELRGNPYAVHHPTSQTNLKKETKLDPSSKFLDSTTLVHLQVRGQNQLNKELIELDQG